MDEKFFWRLIEEACSETRGRCQQQAEALTIKLARLDAQEIEDFAAQFDALMRQSYTWDLWGAAHLITGGCVEADFKCFRAWLIGQGRTVFERAVADPENLCRLKIDKSEPQVECEDLLYAAQNAYKELTGRNIPPRAADAEEPTGEPWEVDGLGERLPNLAALFR